MHTNKENGKKYIGITHQEPEKRWRKGLAYKGCISFYSAIQKYGWDGFKHEVLYDGLTAKQAQDKEVELIAKYDAQGNGGYNILPGGDLGNAGRIFSDEVKKKQSIAHKNISPETREKMCKSQKGRKHSPETIEKMKRNNKHTHPTEEHKKHLSEINSGKNSVWYGRKHTPEEIAKIKANSKNRTVEYRKHCSDAKRGKKLSKEHAIKNGLVHRKAIVQYTLDGEFIKEWDCQIMAARALGLKQGSISNACLGRNKTAYGFIWKFKQQRTN